MHKSEIEIFNGLLNLKVKGFTLVRSYFDLDSSYQIKSFGEMQISFNDPEVRHDTIYIGIDPRPSGGQGNKFYFLTKWKHVNTPLSKSIYFPPQNIDSKFKSSFGCSFLGEVKSISLHSHIENSALLRLNFENGSMNFIIHDQYIDIDIDGSKSLDQIQEEYFDSEKGTELLSI